MDFNKKRKIPLILIFISILSFIIQIYFFATIRVHYTWVFDSQRANELLRTHLTFLYIPVLTFLLTSFIYQLFSYKNKKYNKNAAKLILFLGIVITAASIDLIFNTWEDGAFEKWPVLQTQGRISTIPLYLPILTTGILVIISTFVYIFYFNNNFPIEKSKN